MASLAWRAAARQPCWSPGMSRPASVPVPAPVLTSRGHATIRGMGMGMRTHLNANATTNRTLPLRHQPLQGAPSSPRSRAICQFWTWSKKRGDAALKNTRGRSRWTVSPESHIQPLESRFPTKTVIALLAVGGLLFWALGSVVLVEQLTFWEELQADGVYTPQMSREQNEEVLESHFQSMGPALLREYFRTLPLGAPDMRLITKAHWQMDDEFAKISGVPMTHAVQLEANGVIEDAQSFGSALGPGSKPWNFWGVFDGHCGPELANWLSQILPSAISSDLSMLPLSSSSDTITETIMRSFVQVDDRIMDLAKKGSIWEPAMSPIAQAPVQLAMCGSCALLSLYDPANCILRVANVGDSRAVLGRWDAESEKYTCVPLSTDQTGFNPDEVTRIKAAHPGEDDILDPKTGRLLGMAVTRSFGDHRWKWDDDAVRRVQAKFFGPSPRPQSKTPPYMTAEPVVKEVEIVSVNPEEEKRRGTKAKSDFLIMASDGLWDRMSSEDAVLLVQRWLEARERGNGSVLADPQLRRSDWRQPSARILDYDVEEVGYVNWRAEPKYFAIEDDNAAACLLRNALGGSRKELIFSGAVMTSKGRARQVYDDTSIFVVFFDKMEQDGVKKQDEPMTKTRKWLPW